jgi:hypothetical protein
MFTVCAYCGENPPIENSHILPKWTIRFALEGSVTGKLRPTDDVNRRVQDAEKLPLLCCSCEGIFSKLEGEASKQFRAGSITYGGTCTADFFRFLVTILWRVGTVRAEEVRAERPRFSPGLVVAVQTWGEYLRGARSDLGDYALWFALLDVGLSKKVDAYISRSAPTARGPHRPPTAASPTGWAARSWSTNRMGSRSSGPRRASG